MTCRACGIQLSPAPQSRQAVAPVTGEYLPAQHRHGSADRQEPLGLAEFHEPPSAVRQHARMVHLSSDAHFGADSSRLVCPSRGPTQASSSPLGAYSSPAGHRITPHNFTSPLNLPLSTYILVEHPPKIAETRLGKTKIAKRLDWVRGYDMPRDQHASLTCRAEGTVLTGS
jgi:hypothetical protein